MNINFDQMHNKAKEENMKLSKPKKENTKETSMENKLIKRVN